MSNLEKKKKNIFLYFIKMCLLFIIYFIIQQVCSSILSDNIMNERYGHEAHFEMIWSLFVLGLLLLYKNKYIFSQERIRFKEGLKYVKPEIVISCIFLVISVITLSSSGGVNIPVILNILVLCIFVGITEEFLCRGWLFNEFLERFSNNKKEIILSILLSSLVFGLIHFVNISESQNFIQTVIQVLNAAAGGIFLALAYYKTKNIWVVVFSHTLWDFSIFLMQSNTIVECYNESSSSSQAIIASVISGLIIVVGYMFMSYWLYRQTDLYQKDDKDKKKNYLIDVGVVIYIIGLIGPAMLLGDTDSKTCPVYKSKSINDEYQLITYNMKKYSLEVYNEFGTNVLTMYSNSDKDKILLENPSSNKSITLYDGKYKTYFMVDNEDSYFIIIEDSINTILYGRYLKSDIGDSDNYLQKVKDSLKRYHVPEIDDISTIRFINDSYNYPYIKTIVNEDMFIDKDDILYFVKY